jgi:predicted DNA-binding transcriptional regulator YafY
MPKKLSIKKQSLGKRRDKPAGITEKVINLFKILNQIEQGKYPTVEELAKECEVSNRSIYRYLNIIGFIVPITYDGEKGGYRFLKEGALRLIPFDTKELALLSALSDMTSQIGEPVKGSFQKILNKLNTCSKESGRGTSLLSFPIKGSASDSWQWFNEVSDAISDKRQIKIKYHSISPDKQTNRTIDPYGIVFYEGIWFIYAYCHLRKDFRWFALDRIEKATTLPYTFARPDNFNIEKRLRKSWGIWGGEPTEITVRFSKDVAELIKRKKFWHPSENRVVLPSGEVEMTFNVLGTEEIKWWLYSWIPHIQVIKPKSLINEMKKDLTKSLSISR